MCFFPNHVIISSLLSLLGCSCCNSADHHQAQSYWSSLRIIYGETTCHKSSHLLPKCIDSLLARINNSRIFAKSSVRQTSGAQEIICSMLVSENSRLTQWSVNLFRIFLRLWWSRSRAEETLRCSRWSCAPALIYNRWTRPAIALSIVFTTGGKLMMTLSECAFVHCVHLLTSRPAFLG